MTGGCLGFRVMHWSSSRQLMWHSHWEDSVGLETGQPNPLFHTFTDLRGRDEVC